MALPRTSELSCSSRFSPPSARAWASACPYRGPLSKRMADGFGWRQTRTVGPFSGSHYAPSARRPPAMPSDSIVHVVDDDEAARDSLEFLLRTAGFDVRTHETAMAFLGALPQVKTGCVISDVRMPGLSGIDLLKRLKELAVDMPVIIITGHGDVPLAVEAMKFGALDFLEKPFDDE